MTETPDRQRKAGDRLCLRARDRDDLQVIAACLQDALVPLREMAYMADEHRFMAAFNRFQWERLTDPGDVADLTLSQSVLRVDHVNSVQYRGLDGDLDGIKFELLTIMTEPADGADHPGNAGGHQINLLFAGDVALRLQVSDVVIMLQDFGDAWAAGVAPRHDLSDVPVRGS
ncbi:MAG: DUF2948 family protein [Geminicoccaceae bacterium]